MKAFMLSTWEHTCQHPTQPVRCSRNFSTSYLTSGGLRSALRHPAECQRVLCHRRHLVVHHRTPINCKASGATEAPSQGTSEGTQVFSSRPVGSHSRLVDDMVGGSGRTMKENTSPSASSTDPSSSAVSGADLSGDQQQDSDSDGEVERSGGWRGSSSSHPATASPNGRPRRRQFNGRSRANAEEVILEYEELLQRVNEMKKTRRAFRQNMLRVRELKDIEAFAIQNLHRFTLEDTLELLQICAEIEFSVDTSLFSKLLPRLTAWLHNNHTRIEADKAIWTQIMWLYRLSPTLQRTKDGLLEDAIGFLEAHMNELEGDELSIIIRCAAYVDLQKSHPQLVDNVLERSVEVLQSMGAENAADLLWCMARMQYSRPDTVEAVFEILPSLVVELTPKYHANVTWACATLDVSHLPLNDAIRDVIQQQPTVYRAKHLSNFVWAWAKMGYRPTELVAEYIVPQSLVQHQHFAPQDWDSLLYGLCKLHVEIPIELLRHAGDALLRRKNQVMGRTVGGVLKTYGYVGFKEEPYISEMFKILERRVSTFGSYELSNVLVGLGHLGTATPQLLQALEKQALQEVSKATVQGLANITWAFAKLEYRSEPLLEQVSQLVAERVNELSVPDARDLLMSFAWLHHDLPPETAQGVTDRVCRLLQGAVQGSGYRLNARDFATLLWSLAKLDIYNGNLMNILRKQQLLVVGEMNSMDLANCVWGYVKLNYTLLKANFRPIAARALELVDETRPVEMSTILLNMARLEHYPGDELMEAYQKRAVECIDTFSGEALAYLVSAYSFYQYIPHDLLDRVVERVESRPEDFGPSDWDNILFSLARLQYNPHRVLEALDKQLWTDPEVDPPLTLIATIMWTVALCDAFTAPIYDKCLATLQKITPFPELDNQQLRRIYQAHVLACATNRSVPSDISLGLRATMAGIVDSQVGPSTPTGVESRLVNDICATLGRLGIRHKTLVPSKGNLFKVDIVLDRTNDLVAIEAIERKDVSRNTQTLLGHCVYRRRVLEAYGWQVITVNFWDWEKVLLDADAKEEIILALINDRTLMDDAA